MGTDGDDGLKGHNVAIGAEGTDHDLIAYIGQDRGAANGAEIDLVRLEEIERIEESLAVEDPGCEPVKVSVIIPTLNEARNLPHVLERIPTWVHEVIVVDGLSTDDTVEVARRCMPDVRIAYERTRGKGAALRRGFHAARGDIIVMIDADGSTDPLEIPVFVGALLGGADIAAGSRFVQGGGTADMETVRKLGNWALTRLVRVGFGARYSDLCYGFVAFWSDVLPHLDGEYTGFEVETLLHIRALRADLCVAEVPSFEARRLHGVSNLNTIRDGGRVLRSIATEWVSHHIRHQHAGLSSPARRVRPGFPPFQERPRRRQGAA